MRGGWRLTVIAGVVMAAGLTGCSNNDASGQQTTTETTTATSAQATATSEPGGARVTVDGKPQEIRGQVVCSTMGDNLNIAIGGQASGVAVVLAQDGSSVTSVGLGNVNGVVMGYQRNAVGGDASATKDGNSYKVTGTATGVDMANPLQPITKPFEIEVSCP